MSVAFTLTGVRGNDDVHAHTIHIALKKLVLAGLTQIFIQHVTNINT